MLRCLGEYLRYALFPRAGVVQRAGRSDSLARTARSYTEAEPLSDESFESSGEATTWTDQIACSEFASARLVERHGVAHDDHPQGAWSRS